MPQYLEPSGSDATQEHRLRRSSRKSISRRRFEIKGEIFIVTPQDDDEPKSVIEALSCPAKEE
ncbi:hypothetical protein ACLOJK_027819 [Asimina triloba]